jgi:hypothetical protein
VELSAIIPTDNEFEDAMTVARVPRANLARYYLIALERGNSGDSEPEFVPNSNEEQVNLEHVLPKRATAGEWGKQFNVDERRDYLYRLGNLALLQKGPNGRIGNKPFATKAPILAKSSFALTAAIGIETDWDKERIKSRQRTLAALALRVWPR